MALPINNIKIQAYGGWGAISIVFPTGMNVGDLLILETVNGNSENNTSYKPVIPADFTPIGAVANGRAWYWKKVEATDNNRTITTSGPSSWGYVIFTIPNANVVQLTVQSSSSITLNESNECIAIGLFGSPSLNGFSSVNSTDQWQTLVTKYMPNGNSGVLSIPMGAAFHNTNYAVLIVEVAWKTFNLVDDGEYGIKKWDGVSSWVKIGDLPLTEAMFRTYGNTRFNSSRNGLLSAAPILYNWTDCPNYSSKTLVEKIIPKPWLILENNDKLIPNGIQSFSVYTSVTGTSMIRFILSTDGGATWKSFYNNSWTIVDVNDLNDVQTKGMSDTTLNTLLTPSLVSLVGSSTTIRIGMYFKQTSSSDTINVDNFRINYNVGVATT